MGPPLRGKPAILAKVDAAWRLSKDMRLGELIYNAVQQNNDDLFYISDEDLCARLKDLCDYRDILEQIASAANIVVGTMSPTERDTDPYTLKLDEKLRAWRNAK